VKTENPNICVTAKCRECMGRSAIGDLPIRVEFISAINPNSV
jgi:hypothetical protein